MIPDLTEVLHHQISSPQAGSNGLGPSLQDGYQTLIGDDLEVVKDPTLPIYTSLALAARKTGEKQL